VIRELSQPFLDGIRAGIAGWDSFWFRPASPRLLGAMRWLVGGMLLYTHLVWSLELTTFFADDGVLPRRYAELLYGPNSGLWTHFHWVQAPAAMWIVHAMALAVMFCFMIGFQTRICGILSFLLAVSYAHRATGALFGLDQINGFLTLYLAIGPSGAAFSLDAWLRRKRSLPDQAQPTILANLARRLMQVHLCVVYLFAGCGKLQGASWWNGDAIWGSLASMDYQTFDLTGLAWAMWVINIATLVSVAWEVSYPFLIWNRYARPFYLALAVGVHLGIGLFMGMLTFGTIMIIANMAFLDPEFPVRWVRRQR
jgi:hypothetical protein